MSKVQTYIVLIFSFIIGMSIINGMNIFQAKMPNQNLTGFGDAKVTELQSSSTGLVSVVEDVSGIGLLLRALGFIWDAFKSITYIVPLAHQYGIPEQIYLPMQALFTFIEGWFLVQMWTKIPTKNMD